MNGTLINRIVCTVVVIRDRRARRLARTITEKRVEERYDRLLKNRIRLVERLSGDLVIESDQMEL